MPKKETFDFRLLSVAHERLCLSSLILIVDTLKDPAAILNNKIIENDVLFNVTQAYMSLEKGNPSAPIRSRT